MRLNRAELAEHLLELRPKLSEQTVKAYVSMLMNIYFDASRDGNTDYIETDWFADNEERVIEVLENRPVSSRASILAPVSVIINNPTKNKLIRENLKKNVIERQKESASGCKTEKQEHNWIPYEDVLGVWREYKDKADSIIRMPRNLINEKILQEFKKFIILSLTTGIYFPPRRSEWCSVKWGAYDPVTDNYFDIEHKKFVLNKYKTAKIYGRTEIEIPEEFCDYLQQFIMIAELKSEYLLSTKKGIPDGNCRMTAMLNNIFGKNVSTSMLRHIYKTSLHMNMPALQQLQDEARAMGHGLKQSLEYIKH
jgi:integrase